MIENYSMERQMFAIVRGGRCWVNASECSKVLPNTLLTFNSGLVNWKYSLMVNVDCEFSVDYPVDGTKLE